MRRSRSRWALVSTLSLLLLLACGNNDDPDTDTSARDSVAVQQPSPPQPQYSEPQILAVLLAMTTADSAASVRTRQAWNAAAVNRFAGLMLDDHIAMRRQLEVLSNALQLDTLDTGIALQFRRAGSATAARLGGMRGRGVDSTYLAYQIAAHQAYVTVLDQLLLPSAQNAELQETLVLVRNAMAAHLQRAGEIVSTLQAEVRPDPAVSVPSAPRDTPATEPRTPTPPAPPAPEPAPPDTTVPADSTSAQTRRSVLRA